MAVTNPTSNRRPAGRPRSEVARDSILSAAFELLKDEGADKLSIEGVAAKAGVGKATIYRWWSSKGAMIVEAFMRGVSPELAFPDTGSATADIAQQMARLSKVYRGSTGRIVREMIAMGQFDPETLRLLSEGYLRPRREAAKEVLRRGIAQGEFRPDIDLDVVIDALYAPIFHRLLVGHARTDAALLQFMTTTVLGGIAPR